MQTNQDDNSRQVPEDSTIDKQEPNDKINNLVCSEYLFKYLLSFFLLKSQEEKQLQERIEKLLNILNGEITIGVHMQFLIKNNHADLLILKQIKVNYTNRFFLRLV